MHGKAVALLMAGTLMQTTAVSADPMPNPPHARIMNARIAAAFDLARSGSDAFRAMLAAIDASDTYVVIDEGRCAESVIRSCLHMLAPGMRGVRAVRVRVDARQPIPVVVAQLAHELRHATEVAAHPSVVDASTLRAMYRVIGYQSCAGVANECWETRDAQASERLVVDQLKRFQSFAAIKP